MTKATNVPVEDIPRPEISSWGELQDHLERFLDGQHIFRGVSNVRYLLLPSVGRLGVEEAVLEETEQRLFNRFRRESIPHLHSRPENLWEWLALAQHHGTPTRLLDWSESPFVSIYFAVASKPTEDAGLYIVPRPDDRFTADGKSPFEIDQDLFFFPEYAAPRISAQRGLFTVHPDPTQVYSPQGVEQIIIRKGAKADILAKLDAIGIHDSLIYADLDGLSRRLIALETFGRTKRGVTVTPDAGRLSIVPPPAAEGGKPEKFNPRDPHKGQWGGRSDVCPWRLEAEVHQASGNWFRIKLTVRAQPGRPERLGQPVVFHLHDTFQKPEQEGCLVNGAAELEVTAYGAFTVGVLVPQDGTRLELDLADLPDAPQKFRER